MSFFLLIKDEFGAGIKSNAMNMYWEHGGIVPRILNFGTIWR
jgi:hypothetical protein